MTQYGATARKPVSARRNLAPVLGMVILGMAALALTRMQPMHQEMAVSTKRKSAATAGGQVSQPSPTSPPSLLSKAANAVAGAAKGTAKAVASPFSKATHLTVPWKKNQKDFGARNSDFEDKMPVWSRLSHRKVAAAKSLGWRKGTWDNYFLFQRDNNKKLYGTVAKYAQPWKKLSASDLRAARRLGFTERIWRQHDIFDAGGKKKMIQKDFSKRDANFEDNFPVWSQLTKSQLNDAKSLGWVKGTWDNYFLFQEDYNQKNYKRDAKYAQPWDKLSGRDHKAAGDLGFNKSSWGHHDLFTDRS